jgi:hypothetical protein
MSAEKKHTKKLYTKQCACVTRNAESSLGSEQCAMQTVPFRKLKAPTEEDLVVVRGEHIGPHADSVPGVVGAGAVAAGRRLRSEPLHDRLRHSG